MYGRAVLDDPRLEWVVGLRILACPDASAVDRVVVLPLATTLVLGRDPGRRGLAIDDPRLSRRHLRIAATGSGGLLLEDAGSTNGTWCNRVQLTQPMEIWGDAVVRMGSTVLHLGPGLPGEGTELWPMDRLLKHTAARAGRTGGPIALVCAPGTGVRTVARELHGSSPAGGALVMLRRGWSLEAAELALSGGGPVLLQGADEAPVEVVRWVIERAQRSGQVVLLGARRSLGNLEDALAPERRWTLPDISGRRGAVWSVTRGWLRQHFGSAAPSFSHGALNLWLCGAFENGWGSVRQRFDRLAAAVGGQAVVRSRDVRATFDRVADPDRTGRKMGRPEQEELEAALRTLPTMRAVAEHFGSTRRQIYRWMEFYGVERPART